MLWHRLHILKSQSSAAGGILYLYNVSWARQVCHAHMPLSTFILAFGWARDCLSLNIKSALFVGLSLCSSADIHSAICAAHLLLPGLQHPQQRWALLMHHAPTCWNIHLSSQPCWTSGNDNLRCSCFVVQLIGLHGCFTYAQQSKASLISFWDSLCQQLMADVIGCLSGFVRYTTSRFMPPAGLNNGSGDFTLARPVPPPPEDKPKKRSWRDFRR